MKWYVNCNAKCCIVIHNVNFHVKCMQNVAIRNIIVSYVMLHIMLNFMFNVMQNVSCVVLNFKLNVTLNNNAKPFLLRLDFYRGGT